MKSIIFAWIASSVSALRRLSIIDIGGSEDGVFSIVSEDVEYTDVSVEHTGCTADEVSCDGDRDQFWLNGVCHARLQLGQECVNTEESIGNVCMDALVCHEGICQAPPDEISCSKCSCAHCEQQMDREQRGSTDLLCDVSCIPLMMNVNETCADVTLAVTVTVIVENTKDGLTGRGSGSHTETKTIKKCLPCNLSSHDNNVMHTTQAIDQARAECNRTGYHAARSIATDLAHESAHDHGSVPTPPPKTVAETNPPLHVPEEVPNPPLPVPEQVPKTSNAKLHVPSVPPSPPPPPPQTKISAPEVDSPPQKFVPDAEKPGPDSAISN